MAPKFRGDAWADLCDTSQEGPKSPRRPPVPLNAESYDSYCQTPDPYEKDLAENSEAAMNLQLEQMFKNEGVQLGNAPATSSSAQPSAWASSSAAQTSSGATFSAPPPVIPVLNLAAAVAATDARWWQPNAMAPAFFPTRSLVADAGDAVGAFRVAQPAPGPPVRRRIMHKRGASALLAPSPQAVSVCPQGPAGKRPREAPTTPAVGLSQALAAQRPSPPAASEEDWQRRAKKRREAVEATKETAEYKSLADRRRQQPVDDSAPRTPDWKDRMSKRSWEEELRLWRLAIRC